VTRRPYLMVWPALAVIVLDQATKWAVTRWIQPHETIPVVKGFFNLIHVRNRGIAFGVMNNPGSALQTYLLLGGSLLAICVLFWWFKRLGNEGGVLTLSLSLVMGGALGNLMDRFRLGEVIDFLDLHLGSYHWPAFNVADSAITVGTLGLALSLLIKRKGGDRS
jgi:signal peptidase II